MSQIIAEMSQHSTEVGQLNVHYKDVLQNQLVLAQGIKAIMRHLGLDATVIDLMRGTLSATAAVHISH